MIAQVGPAVEPRAVDEAEPFAIAVAERDAVPAEQMRFDRLEILRIESFVRRHAGVGVEDLIGRGRGTQTGRARPREHARHELGAIRRHLEERLVGEVEIEIAAAQVDDERDRRAHGGDVGEVLLGADADVGAPRHGGLRERRQNGLEADFVRDQVLRMEHAARLREGRDQRAEFLIAQPGEGLLLRDRHERAQHQRDSRDRQNRRRQFRVAMCHKRASAMCSSAGYDEPPGRGSISVDSSPTFHGGVTRLAQIARSEAGRLELAPGGFVEVETFSPPMLPVALLFIVGLLALSKEKPREITVTGCLQNLYVRITTTDTSGTFVDKFKLRGNKDRLKALAKDHNGHEVEITGLLNDPDGVMGRGKTVQVGK